MSYASNKVVHIVKGKETGKCTVSAFNDVWKDRGWSIDKSKGKKSLTDGDNGSEVSTDDKKEEAK